MKDRNRKKIISRAITALLAAAVLFCGWQVLTTYLSDIRAKKSYTELAGRVMGMKHTVTDGNAEESVEAEEPQPVHYPPLELDMALLNELNSDFRGWLYFPLLEISYPVVQGEDNDYYLNHSFEGEDLKAGCIFMDCGAASDWSDRNTFVFGHNTKDGSMFGTLKRLMKEPGLCAEDPHFYIYTEDSVYIYQIFSYYITSAASDRFRVMLTDEGYDKYVEWAVENSEYESDADLSNRGNIVTLSTCYGRSGTSRRLLIHGVLWAVEPYQ